MEEKVIKNDVKVKPKKNPKDKLFKLDRQPLIISSSPHLNTTDSVPKIMWTVIIALLPAVVLSIYYFGLPALWMMSTCVISAGLAECLMN